MFPTTVVLLGEFIVRFIQPAEQYRSLSFTVEVVALIRAVGCNGDRRPVYLELVYLVTALVPSDTACLASSPGRSRRTAVWISRDVMVERLL